MSSPATPRASQQPSLLQLKRVVVPCAVLATALFVRFKPWVAVGRLVAAIVALAWASVPYWAVFVIGAVFGTAILPSLQAAAPHLFSEVTQSRQFARRGEVAVPVENEHVPIMAAGGVMRGTVFTIPGSAWKDHEGLVGTWPPAHTGKQAKCLKWTAHLDEGWLVMRQDDKNELRVNGEGHRHTIPMDVRIPLEGLSIDLLDAATNNKTRWIRKVPMRLIFPFASLPYSETSFVFFANNASEKEQWYLSLYWGAAFFDAPDSAPPGEHSLGLRAQRLYDAFSAHMRNVAPVILPLARPPSAEGASTGAAAAGAAAAGAEPRRRWWGGRGSKRMAPASTKADKPGSKSRHAATGSGAQVVGDFISDKQWGSGPPSKTAAGGGKSSRGRNKIIAKLRSSSATDLSVMRPAGSSPPPSPHPSGGMPDAEAMTLHPRASHDGVQGLSSSQDVGLALSGDSPEGSEAPLDGAELPVSSGQHTPPPEASSEAAAPPDAASPPAGSDVHADLFSGHRPEHLAGLHAINMMIVRAAFDLIRSERFHARVRERLQVKLANINVPHYITPLRLESLALGNVPPMIRSAYSLPSPGPTLMPRLVMHVVYSGRASIVVRTNVDLKESSGFFNFDRAAAEGAPERELREQESGLSAVSDLSGFSAATSASSGSKGRSGVVRGYQSVRNMVSGGMRRVVGSIVESVARTPVNLEITISELDGTLMLWMPPPPSNNLWVSFLEPPKVKLHARPLNMHSLVQYTATAVKLSGWLEHKIKTVLQKNMVFPACTDVRLGFLLDVWELETPLVLPLELPPPREGKAGVAASAAAAKRKGAVTKVGDSDGPDAAAADEAPAKRKGRRNAKASKTGDSATPAFSAAAFRSVSGATASMGATSVASAASAPGGGGASTPRRPFMRLFGRGLFRRGQHMPGGVQPGFHPPPPSLLPDDGDATPAAALAAAAATPLPVDSAAAELASTGRSERTSLPMVTAASARSDSYATSRSSVVQSGSTTPSGAAAGVGRSLSGARRFPSSRVHAAGVSAASNAPFEPRGASDDEGEGATSWMFQESSLDGGVFSDQDEPRGRGAQPDAAPPPAATSPSRAPRAKLPIVPEFATTAADVPQFKAGGVSPGAPAHPELERLSQRSAEMAAMSSDTAGGLSAVSQAPDPSRSGSGASVNSLDCVDGAHQRNSIAPGHLPRPSSLSDMRAAARRESPGPPPRPSSVAGDSSMSNAVQAPDSDELPAPSPERSADDTRAGRAATRVREAAAKAATNIQARLAARNAAAAANKSPAKPPLNGGGASVEAAAPASEATLSWQMRRDAPGSASGTPTAPQQGGASAMHHAPRGRSVDPALRGPNERAGPRRGTSAGGGIDAKGAVAWLKARRDAAASRLAGPAAAEGDAERASAGADAPGTTDEAGARSSAPDALSSMGHSQVEAQPLAQSMQNMAEAFVASGGAGNGGSEDDVFQQAQAAARIAEMRTREQGHHLPTGSYVMGDDGAFVRRPSGS